MATIWKKVTQPTEEDLLKESVVRKNLTIELGRSIREIQQKYMGRTEIIHSDDCANNLCSVLESMFIHGLKDKLTAKVTSVFANTDKIPEPQFWIVVSGISHKNVISDVNQLSQITSDVGRCRAWLRMALNEGLIISYVGTMLSDKSRLQKYYNMTAYLRDDEQTDIMLNLLEGINVFCFQLSCNNSTLNVWDSLPLILSNIWIPPLTPEPVMPAVDVIDFFTDKNFGKSSKNASPAKSKKIPKARKGSKVETASTTGTESDASSLCELSTSEITPTVIETVQDNHPENITEVIDIPSDVGQDDEISTPDSIPDFGDNMGPLHDLTQSMGNKLNDKSGWSSSFDFDQEFKTEKDSESDQSYDSLLQSYNKTVSNVIIGTPELTGVFSSVMGSSEDHNDDSSTEAKSPELDFEIVPKYLTQDGADEETKRLFSIIGKITPQQGLDTQHFQCYACGRPVGLIYGKPRLCYLDGYSYCFECHDNDEYFIPARVIHNWDFKQYPVCKRSKLFLLRVDKDPLLDIKILNPIIYTSIEEMAHVQLLRTQLTFLRSYIFTCKESIVEELRARIWPREYLYEHVHLYSMSDLLEIPSGVLAQSLQKIIAFAKRHVLSCQLCILKGFICEVCNNPKVIYPFDVDSTYHCERCLSVYHAVCMDDNKYCPKCMRRRKRQLMAESSDD